MSRKRSISSLIDDQESISRQPSHSQCSHKNRSISSLIDEDQESTSKQPSLSQRSRRNRLISSLIDDIDED